MPVEIKSQKEEEDGPLVVEEQVPAYGTNEWIHYWSKTEGHLPSPINISITGSLVYQCPELKWFNFDVVPHKIKMTNTGYTVIIGAKWKKERPFLQGGPLLEKHVLSQIHFHWGANMMEGSDHTVDNRRYPAEMQVTYFRSEYLTQQEALLHPDGVVIICYMIKYAVDADEKLALIVEGLPRVQEAQTHTRIGPCSMSKLMPMFKEDYFFYWGSLDNSKGESFVIRWLIPRIALSASYEQLNAFRKLWNPWDEPNLRNFRPLQEREDRHVFFINPHWSLYNSLLPLPRVPEPSISELSPAYYKVGKWMLPGGHDAELSTENLAMRLSYIKPSQSPIVINTQQCNTWSTLDPLDFKSYWDNVANGVLLNNGRTAYFTFEAFAGKPHLSGGPLLGSYVFEQMHFHWSSDNVTGCEHLINHHGYAAECHLVHYYSKYPNMKEAVEHVDGLAAVAIMLDAKEAPNEKFQVMADAFEHIRHTKEMVRLPSSALEWIDTNDLREGNYITYKGSLTIPPYTECVTWIIFEKPIKVGISQVEQLRQLEAADRKPIGSNVRPIQQRSMDFPLMYVRQKNLAK